MSIQIQNLSGHPITFGPWQIPFTAEPHELRIYPGNYSLVTSNYTTNIVIDADEARLLVDPAHATLIQDPSLEVYFWYGFSLGCIIYSFKLFRKIFYRVMNAGLDHEPSSYDA